MLNSSVNRTNILLPIIFGILFGLAFIGFLPLASTNIFFILAIPLVCAFFLLMVISVRSMLIVLLFLRALVDPLLKVTKLNVFGENIGIGGVINFFIIILAIFLIIRNPHRLSQNNFYKSWILFLFICGIAVIYTPFPGRGIKVFLNLTSYMSMAIIPFFVINNMDDKKFWIKILIFSSLLPVGFSNLDLLMGGTVSIETGMRIKGTFMHPNILAFYLVFTITLAFYIIKSGLFALPRSKRNMLRLYMVNLLVLLVATKTRNAWISCWGLFFIYGLLKEKKYLFFAILIPPLLLLSPFVMERIRDLFIHTGSEAHKRLSSFAWRLELWEASLPWIKKKFIFGYGLGSFRNLSHHFFALEEEAVPSHNTYIELLFEIGVAGLLSYLAIYLTALRRFFSRIKKATVNLSREYTLIVSYIISYMIICFADNILYYLAFNWYFWFFIGIMLRGINFDDKKKDIRSNSFV